MSFAGDSPNVVRVIPESGHSLFTDLSTAPVDKSGWDGTAPAAESEPVRAAHVLKREPVTRQRLAVHQAPQLNGKVGIALQAARLEMQMPQVETPALHLSAPMLAHQAVQPALEATGELEVSRVQGQDQGIVHHTGIEPVGQDQLDAVGSTMGTGQFLPFVDP